MGKIDNKYLSYTFSSTLLQDNEDFRFSISSGKVDLKYFM